MSVRFLAFYGLVCLASPALLSAQPPAASPAPMPPPAAAPYF